MSARKGSKIVLGLVTFVLLLSMVSCAPAATPAPAATSAPAQPTADTSPIVIAVAAPMTGDAADYGLQETRGIQIALDEINAKGGVNGRQLTFKTFDDKCDPQEAASVAQKIVSDPSIFVVLGHICSSTTLAAGPIYDAAGITELTVNSTNPKVTEQGWTHLFRSTPTDATQGISIVDYVTSKLNLKKIGILSATEDYGAGLREAAKSEIQKVGATLVADETFISGQDKDFNAQLTKIDQAKPDVFLAFGHYADLGLILKQRMSTGLANVKTIIPAAGYQQDMINLAGPGAEGVIIAVFYSNAKQTPENLAFVKKVADKYNAKPGEQTPWGYDGAYILAQAIGMGCTKETLSDCMKKVDYNGLTGHVAFDEKGQVLPMLGDFEVIKNGAFTVMQ